MATAEQSSTETLFHHWRRGDAHAGKVMAQRFTDWYYAIAVTRLGEAQAEEPFRAACSKFSKGVVKVTDPRRLLGWAHNIARKQLHTRAQDGWAPGGDLPNTFSRNGSPKELLVQARSSLPQQMALLERTYTTGHIPHEPLDVLTARYELKTWLRDHAQAPFRITPQDIDPDRTPLPFYESGHLGNDAEEVHFELYMLNAHEICQDVAEFAHFAIALRGGLPAAANPTSAPTSPTPRTDPTRPVLADQAPSNTPFVVVLAIGLIGLFGGLWMMAHFYAN
jgi:hypothetical protein